MNLSSQVTLSTNVAIQMLFCPSGTSYQHFYSPRQVHNDHLLKDDGQAKRSGFLLAF